MMDSLHSSLGFSPDWQEGNSIQTGVGRNGGFDHLFAADSRSAQQKSAMKRGQVGWPLEPGLAVVWKNVYQLRYLCVLLTLWNHPRTEWK